MLTAKEVLDLFNSKFTNLPKGVSARIHKEGVIIGTKELVFSLQGESLAHGEDYMLLRAKQSLTSLKEVLEKK